MTRLPASLRPPSVVVVDAGIAALVATLAVLLDAFGPDHRGIGSFYWDIALALPLVLRRRAPAAAAAAIATVCLAQWTWGSIASGDFVVLVMLYSLGAWERRRTVLVAAAVVAEVGVVMAVTRWAPPSHAWLSALMVTGTVTAAWVLGIYVRTRRAYVASVVERAETAERERDAQDRIAVVAERTRMAREMHDVIAHSLSVMITLNDAAAAVSVAGEVRDTVLQASEVGRQALAEMQRMLGVLRSDGPPDLVPQPGAAQLSDLVALVRSAGLTVELAVTGELAGLAPTAGLAVYRIVQESLTNVLKHGRNVRRVHVEIVHRGHDVMVRVHDDGHVTTRDEAPTGHGLAGMRERVGLYGGTLEAGPVAGGGWLVRAGFATADDTVVAS